MSGRYRLKKQANRLNKAKQDEPLYIPGSLGATIGGSQKVEVPSRPGFVYVRLRNDLSELVQAYNDKVSVVYGLPVIVIRDSVDNSKYTVYAKDTGIYGNWGSTAYLPRHGAQHSFDPNSPGADPVWVWDNQIMQFAPIPSGSNGGLNIIIEPGVFYSERYDRWIYCGNTGTPSFSSLKPTDNTARAIFCYMDFDGNPKLSAGSYFAATITGTSAVLGYLPIMPADTEIPICAVRLLSGTSSIVWDNIYNLRQFPEGYNLGTGGTGSSGATSFLALTDTPNSYSNTSGQFVKVNSGATALEFVSGSFGHVIQDDAVSQTQRAKLNFVGTRFVVYDDSSNNTTIVSGTSSQGALFSGTVGPNEAAFGDDGGTITSDSLFKVYTGDGYPELVIGGVGDLFNDFESRNISLINPGVGTGAGSMGIYSYGGSYSSISLFTSLGTESIPSGTLAGATLGSIEFGGTAGGSGDFLTSSIAIRGIADDDFSASEAGASISFYVTEQGGFSQNSMLDIHYNLITMSGTIHAYSDKLIVDGDIEVGSASSIYFGSTTQDGSWRIRRSGNDLVFERRESSSWINKQTISA